jgi:hypothetical protein
MYRAVATGLDIAEAGCDMAYPSNESVVLVGQGRESYPQSRRFWLLRKANVTAAPDYPNETMVRVNCL